MIKYSENLSLINSRQLLKTSQRVWYLSSLWPHWELPIAVPMTTSLKLDKFVKRIKKSGCMLMLPMQEVLSFVQNIGGFQLEFESISRVINHMTC